ACGRGSTGSGCGHAGDIGLGSASAALMPNPVWVRWEHSGSGAWPPFDIVDAQQADTGITLPRWLEDIQQRIQTRLSRTSLPLVVGHADWEAQKLRWEGHTIHSIHD